jgi:glyoxylase-like metal-dependent hydrolase (beta-lactamase superfamily II)
LPVQRSDRRLDGRLRHRAVGARVQIGDALEERELGAKLVHGPGILGSAASVILERSMHPEWLSNAYLLAAESGGSALVIDSGAPAAPLLEAAERLDLRPERLFLTHHHHDHVAENHVWKERFGVEVLAHPQEAERLVDVDRTIEAGERLGAGGLEIEALHTPGHTAGMLSFRVNGEHVFTGDTLFRHSVGGVKASGATGFADLKRSIMEVLMKLPPETQVHPGHTDLTTIGEEWEHNPFVRLWRGLDRESDERCRVWEREAALVLWAPDYDGGHKAWIRWDDSGEDDIVPGSQVERLPA